MLTLQLFFFQSHLTILGVFKLFRFTVIVNITGLGKIILLFVFYLPYSSFPFSAFF